LLILLYPVSALVMDLIVVFTKQSCYTSIVILFVFMLALLCFCVATEFSVNKDLYKRREGRSLLIRVTEGRD